MRGGSEREKREERGEEALQPTAKVAAVADVRDKLKGLPAKPGVYLFRDARGDVLYDAQVTIENAGTVEAIGRIREDEDRTYLSIQTAPNAEMLPEVTVASALMLSAPKVSAVTSRRSACRFVPSPT